MYRCMSSIAQTTKYIGIFILKCMNIFNGNSLGILMSKHFCCVINTLNYFIKVII